MAKTLLSIARWTQPSFTTLAARRGRAQLLAIPYSHYCEMASWSLRVANIPTDVHKFAPGQHILPVLSVRLAGPTRHLSSTSAVTAVESPHRPSQRYKPHYPTAVPACILPDGRVLVDSWAILRESAAIAGLPPPSDELQEYLDRDFAPLVRQAIYEILFRPVNREVWEGLVTSNGGAAWSFAWRAGVGQRLTGQMVTLFATDDSQTVALGRTRLRETFDRVEQMCLGDLQGAPFLGGTTPGFSDIALAALTAPLIQPALYCEGEYAKWFQMVYDNDPVARDEIDGFRATALGCHALKVYNACRIEAIPTVPTRGA